MSSIRRALAGSHVAAVTIAILLLWTIDGAFRAFWPPFLRATNYVMMAVATLDVSYLHPKLSYVDRSVLLFSCLYVYGTVVSLSAAWILSLWVYRTGPFGVMRRYHVRFKERKIA